MDDKWMIIGFTVIFVSFIICMTIGGYYDSQVKQAEVQAIMKLSEKYPEVIGKSWKEAGEIISEIERKKRQSTMKSQ